MARSKVRVRAFFEGLWERRKQGLTALLTLLASLPEWVAKKLVITLASNFVDRLIAIVPAVFHEHGAVRLSFIVQILAALALIHLLRKAAARAEAQLLIIYCLALSIFYAWPALTAGSPVPVGMVTGNALREASFGVMSCSLIGLCRIYGAIPRRVAVFVTFVLVVLQVLVVTSLADAQTLNFGFSGVGMLAAGMFAHAIRDRISKPALRLLNIYCWSLALRPLISGLTDAPIISGFPDVNEVVVHALTLYYYFAMLAKLPALVELAYAASRDGSNGDDPPNPPYDDWPMHLGRHTAS